MIIKGYTTANGYMGWVITSYQLFSTEDEYLETVQEIMNICKGD